MTELKPCPACGKPVELEGGQSWHDQHCFLIKCYECGCSRVSDTDKDECVRRWNALPRPLRWTKEPPTEPGWYYLRSKIPYFHGIVEIVEEKGNLYVLFPRCDFKEKIPSEKEWAKIQEPVE